MGKQSISASTDWVDTTLASLSVCPRDLVRSAVSIELAALDAARKDAASTVWEARLAATGRLLRHGLHCFPLDGNMWLRLAMVEFAGAGPTSTVEEMLRLSADTAPSEAWIIAPRIAFAARLTDFPLPGARQILEKDIATFAQHGNVIEVGALYAQVGAQTRQMFDAQITLIDSERRTALERAIEFERKYAAAPQRALMLGRRAPPSGVS